MPATGAWHGQSQISMQKILFYSLGAIIVAAAAVAFYFLREPIPASVSVDFSAKDFNRGLYPVGSITNFVKNFDEPFDAWGAQFGGKEYRALIEKVSATGEPRTTVTEIWYPAKQAPSFPIATYSTFFGNNEDLAQLTIRSLGGPFAVLGGQLTEEDVTRVAAKLGGTERRSTIGAPVAAGNFPLIVFVHGMTGHVSFWNDTAEMLASRGFVVVAVNLTSDGLLPPIFSDPNSQFAAATDAATVLEAYEVMAADIKAFPHFFKFLYGIEVENLSPENFPDLGGAQAPAEGAKQMTEMMARLFQQRVDDVAFVIGEMRTLAATREACESYFAVRDLEGKYCGLLADSIDFERIGISGHSLGSITTQVALRQLPELTAGFGFNNGIPKRWEPHSHGIAPEGTLENIEKPMFFLHGAEDSFIFFVFKLLFKRWYEDAGGDPSEIFVLDNELAPRTDANTQPVALAAYERATGPKVIAAVKDVGHLGIDDSTRAQILAEHGAQLPTVARRLPNNKGLLGRLPGPKFRLLHNATDNKEQHFDLRTFIAHYYLATWFDLTLKEDKSGLERLQNPPFSDYVDVQQSGL